jgi:glyoxylase-like metal-dependent hydrolase (beta-lactamase superfamily II)
MRRIALIATAVVASALGAALQAQPAQPPRAQQQVPLALWRLDCGEFTINQYGAFFSDTFQYPPGPKSITDSCYLIRHGDRYLLWDTGLPEALIGHPMATPMMTLRLARSIADQLGQIGVRPEQIELVGISHWHFDHLGQVARFPGARLLMGAADIEMLRAAPPPDADSATALARWLTGGGAVEAVTGDHDVFGDGSVVMLTTPGHTPGHHSLLVRLASGPVLLTGDLYHFTEQVENRGVPPFNHNRADTLASMDRFDRIARNLRARVIIQHEPADIAKLPAFPRAAQ